MNKKNLGIRYSLLIFTFGFLFLSFFVKRTDYYQSTYFVYNDYIVYINKNLQNLNEPNPILCTITTAKKVLQCKSFHKYNLNKIYYEFFPEGCDIEERINLLRSSDVKYGQLFNTYYNFDKIFLSFCNLLLSEFQKYDQCDNNIINNLNLAINLLKI